MKFEFCGKLDCPDWILAQLFHASQMPSDEFRYMCTTVQETIYSGGILNEVGFFTKLEDLTNSKNSTGKIQMDIDDVRACFAAINYIMTNSVVYQVSSKQIYDELEQLGLSSGHCATLCEFMSRDNVTKMRQHLVGLT